MAAKNRIALASARNPFLQELRRALEQGELTADGCLAVEGPHLVEEAVRSGLPVTALVAARGAEALLGRFEAATNGRAQSYLVPERAFRALTQTETPQGVAALVRLAARRLDDCLAQPRALAAVLVGVQDPGNLGTVMRSLEAFGGAACLLTPKTVSPFNAKAVRASAGSIFRVPVFTALPAEKILAACRAHKLKTVGLAPRAGQSLGELDLRGQVAFFIGQEAAGLPRSLLTQLDTTASIPLAAPVESLNAAMAATLALYEAARQRAFR